MDFGLAIFPTDYAVPAAQLARAAEERGFESLFFPEHTHIPASRETPYPAGGDLPLEYWHTHDPFVALASAAAVTEKLRVATGICLVIERDPILMAKEVATVDFLSNGRMIFGIGGGWVKIPKAVVFAVGYELSAIFLRFALVHEPAIQGSGGDQQLSL